MNPKWLSKPGTELSQIDPRLSALFWNALYFSTIKFGGPTIIFFFLNVWFQIMWPLNSASYFFNVWFEIVWVRGTKQFDGTLWPLGRWFPHTQNISTRHYSVIQVIIRDHEIHFSRSERSHINIYTVKKAPIWSTFRSPVPTTVCLSSNCYLCAILQKSH